MKHPFEVGKTYQDRNGRYEVLAVKEIKMVVRYDDGRAQAVDIITQTRIGESMRLEAEKGIAAANQKRSYHKSASTRSRKKGGKATKSEQQEKLIAEILENDEAVFEILTRLVIPPGQINTYRLFIKHPDDDFSLQQIADETRDADRKSMRGVLMAFGRRIGGSPDPRVKSLKPRNALFFEHRRIGGESLYRIRRRVVQIFKSFPAFYDFLINDTRSWLPDGFGSPHWENSPAVHRLQMHCFGFWDRYLAEHS